MSATASSPAAAYRGTPRLSPHRPARRRPAGQPWLGLAGLAGVVAVAVALAVSLGDLEDTALVLGPLTTFTLPAIATVAFWWEDWPGRSLRAGWAGLADTLLVVAAGILLTLLGQAVVTGLDPRGVFLADPGPGHTATYPATMPLAGAAFTVMLQLTLVTEGWPLRRLGRIRAGLAALALSWAVAVAAWVLLVEPGPLAGLDPETFGVWLIVLGLWQVVFFVVLHGRPFTRIADRAWRLTCANAATVLITAVSYPALRAAGLEPGRIAALGGTVVAAGLVVAMLFDGWPGSRLRAPAGEAVVLVTVAAFAAILYGVLTAVAAAADWHRMTGQSWIALAALNFVGMVVILHVAVWRRWPVRSLEGTDAA